MRYRSLNDLVAGRAPSTKDTKKDDYQTDHRKVDVLKASAFREVVKMRSATVRANLRIAVPFFSRRHRLLCGTAMIRPLLGLIVIF